MELYNVVQFFPNGQYEYVRKHVSAKEAVNATQHYTQAGSAVRVIITDMMDCICFEWNEGRVIYPTQELIDGTLDAMEKNDASEDA